MTYQTIVPECQTALESYDVTTGGWCVAASHSAPHPAHPTPGPTLTPLPLPSRSSPASCKTYVEMALGDNSCTRGQLAMMPASDFTTEFTTEFNAQLAEYEGVVDSLCAPACAEESLPTLITKVEACVSSLTSNLCSDCAASSMQCSPACTDMLSAVQSSSCYTSQSFASSIPAEMWTTMTQACQLFDTCYDEQMTYQTIVPQCQTALESYDVTTGGW